MLVLTRKPGESLKIGDVTLIISEITRTRVRIAIDAPANVIIARCELGEWDVLRKPRSAIEAAKRSAHLGSTTVFDDEDCKPVSQSTAAAAGSPERIAELARRAEAGETLWSDKDRERRLRNGADIAAWVACDMAAEHDTRRTFELKYDAVFTLPGRLVYVDRVGLVGLAIVLRDAETSTWFSADDVLEPLASPVWKRIHAVVQGKSEYGHEVRSV